MQTNMEEVLDLQDDFGGRKEEFMEKIRNFILMDDDFMSKVFEDKACAEFLLHIILDRDDLEVVEVHPQYEIKNLQGRSVRLDILAVDDKGKYYNIGIQRNDRGAVGKRARYNSSLIDANITEPGDDYEKLNESYVIFITEKDALKKNRPIYHIDRVVRETGDLFEDGSHIIYVNSQIRDESKLGRLMQDFYCKDADKMNYPVLADRVKYFKESEKGATNMCRAMEELVEKEKIEIAISLWQDGIRDVSRIARLTKLAVEKVEKALENIKE